MIARHVLGALVDGYFAGSIPVAPAHGGVPMGAPSGKPEDPVRRTDLGHYMPV